MTKQLYSTDLTNAQWKLIRPMLPRETRGRPRRVQQQRILNALCYLAASGVPWRLLPREFPKWTLVYYHFRRWNRCDFWRRLYHVLRVALRHQMGRHKHPTAGCQDSQSVKTAAGAGVRGFDNGKKIKGRKRHVLTDTQGLPLEILWRSLSRQPMCPTHKARLGCGSEQVGDAVPPKSCAWYGLMPATSAVCRSGALKSAA